MDPQEPQQPPPLSSSAAPSNPPPASAPSGGSPQIDVQAMLKSFTLPDWLIVGGALVFFIVSFVPWYGASASVLGFHYSANVNAWNYWAGVLAGIFSILVLILGAAFVAARMGSVKLPAMAISDKIIFMAGGALMLLFSIIYLAVAASDTISGPGYSAGPAFGLFLGILASIAVIAGGFLKPAAA
jgi:hypothetical protein